MSKLRLSYSLISLWEKGDYQGAIDVYLHTDRGTSRAMEEGKRFHEDIAKSITETKKLPEYIDFKYEFKNPEPEQKIIVTYNEICDLSAVFDCLDTPDLFEFKTGVSDSLEWSRTFQLPMYFLVAELNGTPVDRGILVRYNQYEKSTDFAIVHNNEKQIEKARNVIDSVCYEIATYFKEKGIER